MSYIGDDTDWEWDDSSDELDTDEYTYGDGEDGVIIADSAFDKGDNNIKVIYTAGYTDANVPEWLRQILIRQVCHWFKQIQDGRFDISSKALPSGGGTTSYNTLKSNLLPDFEAAVERNRRRV